MINTFSILGNLVPPIMASLFFFIFFIYFILAQPSKALSYRRFAIYLISFSIFLIGRPLQMLLGPYPMPLIVNNIRLFLFCTICAPEALLATGFIDQKDIIKRNSIVGIGILLGIIYCIFNTLGTTGSYEAFRIGNIVAFDNLTLSLKGPYYGREVTLVIQVIIGVCLSISTGWRIIKSWEQIAWQNLKEDKFFLTSIGTFLFGLLLVVGTLSKQWWIYYLGSMVSSFILSGGVLLDIKQVHLKIEKVIPFIKEDLIQNMTMINTSEKKIGELLSILGKQGFIDTFLVIKIDAEDLPGSQILNVHAEISAVIKKKFDAALGEENYLLMSLGSSRIGICFSALNSLKRDQRFILNLAEKVREEVEQKTSYTVTIGIGKSYNKLENLRFSYREALDAQEYGNTIGKNQVIHVNDIQKYEPKRAKYPFAKKEELLLAVRLGDVKKALLVLNEFLDLFYGFCKDDMKILKIKLYELIGSIIDAAVLGGSDDEKLHDLGINYFEIIDNLKDIKEIESWLTMVIKEVTALVAHNHKKAKHEIIHKAKEYIERNYQNQILVEDVAREVSVSPSYFKHLFKQESDCSFSDYLTKLRIQKGKELLLNSDLNITKIAFKIGYQNSNYFSNVFKSLEGITPREYRKNIKTSQ